MRTRRPGEAPLSSSWPWPEPELRPPAFLLSLPGVKKPLGQYGPAGVTDSTAGPVPSASKEDDDDLDLFGSDEVPATVTWF